jgi:hypothetical protein
MAQAQAPTGHQHADAWDKNWLRVDDIHEIYYEQYGPKNGKPGKSSISLCLPLAHLNLNFRTNTPSLQSSTSTAAPAATPPSPTLPSSPPPPTASSSSTSAAPAPHGPTPKPAKTPPGTSSPTSKPYARISAFRNGTSCSGVPGAPRWRWRTRRRIRRAWGVWC